MLRNRRPLNPEHQETHLPMGGMIRRRMKRLFAILAVLLAVQILIIWAVEDLSLFEAAWLTMTTLVTVGYGDYSPQTLTGRFSTIVLMFISAITLLTLIVSDYIEYRFYRRERILAGRWIYKMNDHIVIINTPQNGGQQYFMRFASQIRAIPGYETIPIMILTQQFPMGLPTELSDIGVVHYHGAGFDPKALKSVRAGSARHIIVLSADEADPYSDSLTFDIAHRLAEQNLGNHTIVECVDDSNRGRFKTLGIRAVIRPVRTYPEIMVRSLVAPGSEKVLEDLFNYEHDHPHRYDLKLDDLNWADIVSALIRHGIGTALAFIDEDNEVVCQPPTDQVIEGKGLIVLVNSSETPDVALVEEALARYREFINKWHDLQEQAAKKENSEEPCP